MNPFDAVGNFFGGLFGKKKKEDEHFVRPQIAVKQAPSQRVSISQAPTVSVKMPGSLVQEDNQRDLPVRLNLGGVQVDQTPEPRPAMAADMNTTPAKPVGMRIEAPKPVGIPLDLTRRTAPAPAPEKPTGTKIEQLLPSALRGLAKGTTDLGSFVVDAGSHIVDNGLGKNGIGGIFGQDWSPHLVEKSQGITKTLNDTSEFLENRQIEKNGADPVNNLIFSAGQFVDPAVAVGAAGKVLIGGTELLGGVRPIKSLVPQPGEVGVNTAEQVAPTINRVGETPIAPLAPNKMTLDDAVDDIETPRDPGSPITSSPTTNKPPAITSPNRPAEAAPTVQMPQTVVPQVAGNTPPVIQAPVIPNAAMPVISKPLKTVDEAVADIEKNLDEATVQPAAQPPAVEVLNVESPQAAKTREIAEAQVPVAPVSDAQLAQQAINDAPTDAIADELGTIGRKAAAEGRLNNDVDAQDLSNRVGNAIEAEANKLGTTWEDINKKVQAAWSQGKKDFREAGLTQEEFNVARKAADELSLLRSRVDPSLLKEGHVGQFYSPRQAKDTEFTQDLVNEISRKGGGSGLRDNELDLSTQPYRQAVRRYSNAPEAMGDQLVDSLENKIVKDALGNENVVPTGLKVPDDVKAAFKEDLKPYVQAQDDAIRAADAGDINGIDKALAEGDKAIDDALNQMAARLPKDTQEARDAIGALIAERRGYMQSTARTNMFTNIVNRMFDQAQKAIVNFGDQALPLVNKISNKITGTAQPGIATDRLSTKLSKKYAKGTLINQQNRNFMTNVRLAGANARNPLTKTLAKADAAYRAAGTYMTSLGDMSTNAVKATNLTILAKGRAEGLKTADELEAYLIENINSPEYMDIYRNMTNQYSGYIGMPQTLTSTGEKGGKISDFMSKIDNAAKNALDKTPLPNRVKQELNDLLMPAITGFAGATSRVAAKQLNALALGAPNIYRGLKMAASDSPNAKAIGQIMISRSIIDGVLAGGVMTGGALLGSNGQWTGSYPEDPNERARWESEGITANSFAFDVGGKTVYVQPGRILGVLALPMVLPAVIADSMKNGTEPGEAIGEVIHGTIGQFNENLGADAIIGHIGDVKDLIDGNESERAAAQKSLTNMLGYSISNVNFAAGLQNNAAAALDPYKRDTSGGIVDVIKNRNPVTRPSLDIKTDNLGNPIANNSQMTLGAAALTVGDGQGTDKPTQNEDGSANLETEINRLAKAKFEVMPARDVKNSNSQEDAKTLMGSKLYENADDEKKAEYLKKTLLGTETKDINKSLDATDRSALIEHKLQTEDQRKKWLESNDNAASYYAADYNNAKANDTLTSDDENLENKEGAKYRMVRAQVNKEFNADNALKQMYEDVSETEWKAMTDPESEDFDPDTAARLLAYDDARTKAGVSGKSSTSKKNKYALKTGKGGSGSGGGSGSDKFAFASLPSSLIGNTANSSKGYDDGAPTFKPIADLRTAKGAQIPKGRTISVKKGIQI